MKYNDIKAGEYYKWKNEFTGITELIFVIGRDPFSGQFVATCKFWEKSAFLYDYDFKNMEPI